MTHDDLATAQRLAQDLLDRAKALRAFIAHERSCEPSHDDDGRESIDEYNSGLIAARDTAYHLVNHVDVLHQYLKDVK